MRKFPFYIFFALSLLACNKQRDSSNVGKIGDVTGLIELAEKYSVSNSDTALVLARMAYEFSSVYDDRLMRARSNDVLGRILYEMGGLSQSIDHLNQALLYYEEAGLTREKARADILIARVYSRSENYRQSLKHLLSALKAHTNSDDQSGLAEVFGELGHLFEKTEKYDSALQYQSRALDLYDQLRDTAGLASIHDNIGSVHEDLGAYEKALHHFQQALRLNTNLSNRSAATVNLNNIGDIYRKTGQLAAAENYSLKALESAKATQQDYQVKSACRDLSKVFMELEDFQQAYHYLEKSYELTDDIFSDQIAEELARSQSLYELQQKQQRITLLEREREANLLITYLSVGAILSFLFFGGFIFYQQKSKNRKEKNLLEAQALLARKELENTQLNEQKLKAELENKLLREEQLKNELDLKSQSLTNSALHMIQKNEFLSELRSKLKDLKKAQGESSQKKIKRLIKSIDLNFNMDDDWQEFESIFQEVHNDFFRKLNEMYPDLSASEVRLCAMIRLNLQSKDMAAIMGISQDSLRIARYRLRKRLGLERGANLYNFIINIG